jgi:hypothetical protein
MHNIGSYIGEDCLYCLPIGWLIGKEITLHCAHVGVLLFVGSHSGPGTTSNALVGHFVHWMGYGFSFGVKWGSSQFIYFRY